MLTGMTQYLPEAMLTTYDNLEFALRILFAAVMGIIVGFERSRRLKEAGIRTHCIIAMTAAVFMILSKYAFFDLMDQMNGVKEADPSRIASQVVSGISFLGAGIIFKQGKNSVRGLTTAAGMWATAAIGMAIGAGLYWVGIVETAALLLLQTILHRHQYGNDVYTEQNILIRIESDSELAESFYKKIEEREGIVESSRISRRADEITLQLSVRLQNPLAADDGMRLTKEYPEIREIQIETV